MGETFTGSIVEPDFLVDNDLSPLIAKTLRLFDYRVATVAEVFQTHDEGDPEIIEWLGRTRAVWITHDRAAKRRYRIALTANHVTVLWVRGDKLSNWQQTMIVLRVWEVMLQKIASSHGALHFRASLKGGPSPTIDWAERKEDMPKGGRS